MTDHDTSGALDAIIVGAGIAGIATLRRMRQDGLAVRVLEAGGGVGGTWFWNRYPGARVDIESMEYSYPFPEIQGRWRWPEKYSGQEDVRRYLEWVVDELGLRNDIQLNTTVVAAEFDDATTTWSVTSRDADGTQTVRSARYLVLATGFLSVPKVPDIPGLTDFAGDLAFTARWPEEGVDFTGRRVGVLGTAASGIQVIQSAAPIAAELVVLQRTANWAFPLRNVPMSDEYDSWVKENYEKVREAEYVNRGAGTILVGGVITPPNPRSGREVTRDELIADLEFRWDAGGPHLSRSFVDVISDEVVNDLVREWWTQKILDAVDDPQIAAKLVPDHRPMTRRPPGSTNYYEVFNRPNVHLIDIKSDPIERVEPAGVRLRSGELYELDVLVLATGFDAGSGAAMQIDLRGRGGRTIQKHWEFGVRTHLGLAVEGFPNLVLIDGPQSPSVHFSPPLLTAYQADAVARLIAAHADGRTIEVSTELEDRWNDAVDAAYARTLIPQTDSWWMGANIPGKPRRPVAFAGGFPTYKTQVEEWLAELAKAGD
ncbi:MAG TPA: NAD(P)/FAD-dependent oxidoreductase [Pseudolysinimonas sp.]|nr:NAD(P)/FAD-dependent oxidoreductase [Pseudolysinimonas sp.]